MPPTLLGCKEYRPAAGTANSTPHLSAEAPVKAGGQAVFCGQGAPHFNFTVIFWLRVVTGPKETQRFVFILEENAVRGHFKFERSFLVTSPNFGELINSPDYGDISRVFSQFRVDSHLTRNSPKHLEIML
jgi:hypothetical protein